MMEHSIGNSKEAWLAIQKKYGKDVGPVEFLRMVKRHAEHYHGDSVLMDEGTGELTRGCTHCWSTGEEPDSLDINKKDPITKCHVCKGSGRVAVP